MPDLVDAVPLNALANANTATTREIAQVTIAATTATAIERTAP
jgi:hypothetical protein